jgi:hypothetical protein
MRQRAAEGGHQGARPNWKEQETLLVPRSMLPAAPKAVRGLFERVPWMAVAAVLALTLIGSVTIWLRGQVGKAPSVRVVPISATSSPTAPAAALPRTVIATEPSGAELLMAGAVLGNTPIEVARPSVGEETYLLRLRGFESQLVRVTPQTNEAIRVTLLPLGVRVSPPLPAAP